MTYSVLNCVFYMTVSARMSSAVAGGVAGSVVAVVVILIIAAICYWRSQQFLSFYCRGWEIGLTREIVL